MAADRRIRGRRAVGLLVKLKHADVGTFVERFATNISPGGMFIRTRDPKDPGTMVRFEVQIAGGVRVMRGEAVVRWARPANDPAGPPGMGLEFLSLDEASRALIDRMLAARGLTPAPKGPPAPPAEALASDGDFQIELDTEQLVATTPPPAPAPAESPAAPEDDLEFDVDLSEAEDDTGFDLEVDVAPPVRQLVFLEATDEPQRDGPIIGIDLGTTNSCVAVFDDGRPRVIHSREGYNTLPSTVALSKKDKLLVGHPAKSQMLTNPERTVYGAKRLVGRPFDSPTVRMVRERFHYEVCPDALGKAAVRLGQDVVSLEEVQALVLKECREMAQIHLGRELHRAVITVPAYYSDAQRHAVREAGRLAGLHVERILNEPTAAALAYGLNRDIKKKVLIYDLGGGTFDATAMLIDGNVFEVLATGGDTFLGGVDFDAQIVDWFLARFEETTGRPFAGDRVALSRVTDAAERAKIALSERRTFDVQVPFLMMDEDGVPHDLRTTMAREDLESLTGDLVDRTLDVVRDVLLDAALKPADVEEVILVGGQSRMPLVRDKLAQFFGRDAHPGVHPDEAVALGAAYLAGSLDKVSSVVLIDVLPMTIGVGLPGGRFKRVVERNTPLPVTKTYGLATTRDDQRFIEVSVFQGEDESVSENEYLGILRLEGLPPGPRGSVKVAVSFELGQECVLEVEARELTTGAAVKATLATRDTPEDLARRLKMDAKGPSENTSRREAELARRGGRFWSFVKRMVGAD